MEGRRVFLTFSLNKKFKFYAKSPVISPKLHQFGSLMKIRFRIGGKRNLSILNEKSCETSIVLQFFVISRICSGENDTTLTSTSCVILFDVFLQEFKQSHRPLP